MTWIGAVYARTFLRDNITERWSFKSPYDLWDELQEELRGISGFFHLPRPQSTAYSLIAKQIAELMKEKEEKDADTGGGQMRYSLDGLAPLHILLPLPFQEGPPCCTTTSTLEI